ncbi:MAG: putative holin [Klebsiella grimontii]|nr:putative holin [Klebsiella grimontii]
MSDPLTVAGGFAAGTVGVTLATLFPEATPGVMLFSLGGAALYVLTSEPHQIPSGTLQPLPAAGERPPTRQRPRSGNPGKTIRSYVPGSQEAQHYLPRRPLMVWMGLCWIFPV